MQQTTTNITNGDTNNSSGNNNRGTGRNGHGRGRGTTAVEATEEEDVDVELARNGTNLLHNTNNNNNNHDCDVQPGAVGGGGGGGPDNSNMFVQHKMVPIPQSSYNILRARRGVIRMLIVVVLTFALCNLPIHARKIWQYWWVLEGGFKDFYYVFYGTINDRSFLKYSSIE